MKTLHITFPRHISILYWMIRTSEAFETVYSFISILWISFCRFPLSFLGLTYMFLSMAFCYWPISGQWFAGFMMSLFERDLTSFQEALEDFSGKTFRIF